MKINAPWMQIRTWCLCLILGMLYIHERKKKTLQSGLSLQIWTCLSFLLLFYHFNLKKSPKHLYPLPHFFYYFSWGATSCLPPFFIIFLKGGPRPPLFFWERREVWRPHASLHYLFIIFLLFFLLFFYNLFFNLIIIIVNIIDFLFNSGY